MRRVKAFFAKQAKHDIEYQLIKSAKRKTLSLQVKRGEVFVRSPYRLSLKQVDLFVSSKQAWIKEKIAQQLELAQKTQLHLVDGKIITVLDNQLRIVIRNGGKTVVERQKNELLITLSQRYRVGDDKEVADKIHAAFLRWLKDEATLYLEQRVSQLAETTQLFPSSMEVKKYKARWGSCNSKGQLTFNYLLLLCPAWVVDYVIVHELSHLQHLNHSRDFWLLVKRHCNNTEAAKKWLKSESVDIRNM